MNKIVAVIPVIIPETADKCIKSILMPESSSGFHKNDILIVDNSRDKFAGKYGLETYRDPDNHNLGVARSWNIGANKVIAQNLDYLVIVSASMLFGPKLHCTWLSEMHAHWGKNIIESMGNSWHLIAIHRTVFEKVGLFDANFYPAYFEDIDFGYRMRVSGLDTNWPCIWNNCMSQGAAMHAKEVSVPARPLLDYYKEKWGGDKGEEKFVLPYGNKPIDYFNDISIPELAKKYELKTWW